MDEGFPSPLTFTMELIRMESSRATAQVAWEPPRSMTSALTVGHQHGVTVHFDQRSAEAGAAGQVSR